MTTPALLTRRVMWIASVGDDQALRTEDQLDFSGYARLPVSDSPAETLRNLARWILELNDDEIQILCEP